MMIKVHQVGGGSALIMDCLWVRFTNPGSKALAITDDIEELEARLAGGD